MLEQGKKGKADSEYYALKAQWSVDYFVIDEMAKHCVYSVMWHYVLKEYIVRLHRQLKHSLQYAQVIGKQLLKEKCQKKHLTEFLKCYPNDEYA